MERVSQKFLIFDKMCQPTYNKFVQADIQRLCFG